MVIATRMQCSDPRKRNSITTTLPLKLESIVVLPPGSLIVKSGDLRGTGAGGTPSTEEASTNARTIDVSFFIVCNLASKITRRLDPRFLSSRRFWHLRQFNLHNLLNLSVVPWIYQ